MVRFPPARLEWKTPKLNAQDDPVKRPDSSRGTGKSDSGRRAGMAAPEAVRQLLRHWGARAAGLEASFSIYIAHLLESNAQFNLTGDADPEVQWRRHIEDAIRGALLLETQFGSPPAGLRLLDVGSGAGVPGLIWALLWPEVETTLLESVGKKASFLERATGRVGAERVRVVQSRAEVAGRDPSHRERYDWVVARALAPLPRLAEWTAPLAKVGGKIIAIKADRIEEEIESSAEAFRTLGAADPPRLLPYERSDGATCHLIVYEKTGATPERYPRRAAATMRNPL